MCDTSPHAVDKEVLGQARTQDFEKGGSRYHRGAIKKGPRACPYIVVVVVVYFERLS